MPLNSTNQKKHFYAAMRRPLGRVKPIKVFFLVCGIKGHFLIF